MTNEKCKCRSRFPSGMTNKGAGLSIRGVRRNWRKGVYGCRFSTGAGDYCGTGGFASFGGHVLGSLVERWKKTGIAARQSNFELKGTNGKVTCDRGIAGEGEDDQ
jgi:hypothetical protein